MGFLESIRISSTSPDGEERALTRVSARSNADVVVCGDRVATRTSDGFVITFVNSAGEAGQQRFIPSTLARVNSDVRELARNVNQARTRGGAEAANAQLKAIAQATSAQVQRATQAQRVLDAATQNQLNFQRKAESLAAVARSLRERAQDTIAVPGATLMQNDVRIVAMNSAEDAERSTSAAQRNAELAGAMAAAANVDLGDARMRIALLKDRYRMLSATIRSSSALSPSLDVGAIEAR